MVRETRHLWVGNLPETVREDRIREHFKRYGRVQSVKILTPSAPSVAGSSSSSTTASTTASSSSSGVPSTSSGKESGDTNVDEQSGGSPPCGVASAASGSTNSGSNSSNNCNTGDSCQTTTSGGVSGSGASTGSDGLPTTQQQHGGSCQASGGSGKQSELSQIPTNSCSNSSSNSKSSVNIANSVCATVAFMDIKSASKAHTAEHKFDDRILTTEYYEPSSIPSAAVLSSGGSSPLSCSSSSSICGSVASNCGGTGGGVASATSPTATQQQYSTGSTSVASRFPSSNSHGGCGGGGGVSGAVVSGGVDDHASNFERNTFYERSSRSTTDPDQYIRRPNNYHSTDVRGRARDRLYRNGPYMIERSAPVNHHRVPTNSWYESNSSANVGSSGVSGSGSSRYTGVSGVCNSSSSSIVDPISGYDLPLSGSGLDHRIERRNSETSETASSVNKTPSSTVSGMSNSNTKKKKSRSGSESPCGGSLSSRSHSRSPSSCSSTNSSSSHSHGSSSSPSGNAGGGESRGARGSGQSGTGSSSGSSSANPATHSDDNRPLAICVRNLPARSSDTSLKDGLFHEYKKHGKVTWVKVVGQSTDRYALVCFKKADDVEKALEVSHDKLFFGCKIEVAPYQGYDVDDNEFRPYEAELDEYHPKSTRTLFIGNLEKEITSSDIRKQFEGFGEIIEIDVKKQGISSYAFCQYADIVSVVKAMRKMDGEHLGNNRIKLGFGKSMPTNCVWIDGIADIVSESYLTTQFGRFGVVTQVTIDKERRLALVFFDQIQYAQLAVKEMRGIVLRGRKLQVDFASRECQDAFYDKMNKLNPPERNVTPFEGQATTPTAAAAPRPFEATVVTASTRFSRYDGPPRSRTSSFSRHGSVTGGNSGAASPVAGVLERAASGSTTPRGAGRPRVMRYNTGDFYDGEYSDRRSRNYDEYSQGSGASHDGDGYDHSGSGDVFTSYSRGVGGGSESPPPTRLEGGNGGIEVRRRSEKSPGDIRHLQKERVHLLEQLEECPSSGDELMSPKKRIRYDSTMMTNDTVVSHQSSSSIVQNNNVVISDSICDVSINHSLEFSLMHHHQGASSHQHRKVEVRRLSECSQKLAAGAVPLTRRPSTDNSGRHLEHAAQTVSYGTPHVVCKRRKTGSIGDSDHHTSRGRGHQLHSHHSHEASGGESADGSRPGTPLCDERPENAVPTEPRRIPRDRPHNVEPMVLPLPRFSIQFYLQNRLLAAQASQASSANSAPVTSTPTTVATPTSTTAATAPSSLAHSLSSPPPNSILMASSPKVPHHHHSYHGHHHHHHHHHHAGHPPPPTPVGSSVEQPPASPLRPPSLSSNSSDSEVAPSCSPSLEERIKTLDEMFEKWNGNNANRGGGAVCGHASNPVNAPAPDISSKVTNLPDSTSGSGNSGGSTSSTGTNYRHKFLDLDVNEVPPSDIVRSVLAKKSIFDEDSKRLENIGDKYEPREYLNFARSTSFQATTSSLPPTPSAKTPTLASQAIFPSPAAVTRLTNSTASPLNSPIGGMTSPYNSPSPSPVTPKPSTPVMAPAKGLQYPFPSHPPAPAPLTPTVTTSSAQLPATQPPTPSQPEFKSKNNTITKSISLQEKPTASGHVNRVLNKSTSLPGSTNSGTTKSFHSKDDLEDSQPQPGPLEKEDNGKRHNCTTAKEETKRRPDSLDRRKMGSESSTESTDHHHGDLVEDDRNENEEKARQERERREREKRREREEKERLENEEKERREREEEVKRREEERREKEEKEHKEREERERLENERKAELEHEENERLETEERRHQAKDKENRENPEKFTTESTSYERFEEVNTKRRERNNSRSSSPSRSINKRRLSSQENYDLEEIKRLKTVNDHRKLSTDRKEISRDSHGQKNKHHKDKHRVPGTTKNGEDRLVSEDRCKDNRKESDRKSSGRSSGDKHKSKSSRGRSDDHHHHMNNIDHEMSSPSERGSNFLEHVDMRSSEEEQRQHKKEQQREKKRDKLRSLSEMSQQEFIGEFNKHEASSKDAGENKKRPGSDRRGTTEEGNIKSSSSSDNGRKGKSTSLRKMNNSSDSDDSDEPKKHSIFDIPDEGPTYISMYDKVKARSCKNMQRQEEEKKIKAKFTQLKQSRAKREEKKRSTSWDDDTDSEMDDRRSVKSGLNNHKKINSSSEDEMLINRVPKTEMISDSESEMRRSLLRDKINELCDGESSEASAIHQKPRRKISSRKNSRSTRIASDSSEDEALSKIKEEKVDTAETIKIKTEVKTEVDEKLRSGKIFDRSENEDAHSMGTDLLTAAAIKMEPKEESVDVYKNSLCNISSDEHDISVNSTNQKDPFDQLFSPDTRKKHKKKQKRQKSVPPLTSTESVPSSGEKGIKVLEEVKMEKQVPMDLFDELKKNTVMPEQKKKHSSRKDKKRDRLSKEDYENRERFRDERSGKVKRNKKSSKINDSYDNQKGFIKTGEKMEDIFGPLSDDDTIQSFPDMVKTEPVSSLSTSMASIFDSQSETIKKEEIIVDDPLVHISRDDFKSASTVLPMQSERERHKDESRKRKEKKRREREKSRAAAVAKEDENSVDLDEAGRALEAQLLKDMDTKLDEMPSVVKQEPRGSVGDVMDVFRFTDGDDSIENVMSKDKEKESSGEQYRSKEKKKKKKRSKEEKHQRREHHQSKDAKVDKLVDEQKLSKQSPSLPCLLEESPPPPKNVNLSVSINRETRPAQLKAAAAAKANAEAKRKPEKFIPGFGGDVDETIHESAVKSISTEYTTTQSEKLTVELDDKVDLPESDMSSKSSEGDKVDDKTSRVVISQEETEDAVAALLGESFGSSSVPDYTDCYETPTVIEESPSSLAPDTIIPEEDAEEMRKAVQSLNSEELDMKPDTPQSENDLQIDTDTEEQEEEAGGSGMRFDQPPKTPDVDLVAIRQEANVKTQVPTSPKESTPPVIPKVTTSPASGTSVITKTVSQPVTKPEVAISKVVQIPVQVSIPTKLVETPAPQPLQASIVENPSVKVIPASTGTIVVTSNSPHTRVSNIITTPRPQLIYQNAMRPTHPPPQSQPQHFLPQHSQSQKMQQSPRLPGPSYPMQPPTINIPSDQHYIYQQIGVMMSPRNVGDPRLASPRQQHPPQGPQQQSFGKSSSQLSPTAIIRSQQEPPSPRQSPQQLSPVAISHQQQQQIHAQHMMQQQRQMLSPSGQHPMNNNLMMNRVPVAPILTPISKPMPPSPMQPPLTSQQRPQQPPATQPHSKEMPPQSVVRVVQTTAAPSAIQVTPKIVSQQTGQIMTQLPKPQSQPTGQQPEFENKLPKGVILQLPQQNYPNHPNHPNHQVMQQQKQKQIQHQMMQHQQMMAKQQQIHQQMVNQQKHLQQQSIIQGVSKSGEILRHQQPSNIVMHQSQPGKMPSQPHQPQQAMIYPSVVKQTLPMAQKLTETQTKGSSIQVIPTATITPTPMGSQPLKMEPEKKETPNDQSAQTSDVREEDKSVPASENPSVIKSGTSSGQEGSSLLTEENVIKLSSTTDEHMEQDSKEDSDYWSAKEVNIESVIKKVDALCSGEDTSEEGSEVTTKNTNWPEENQNIQESVKVQVESCKETPVTEMAAEPKTITVQETQPEVAEADEEFDEGVCDNPDAKDGGKKRGRGGRGRKISENTTVDSQKPPNNNNNIESPESVPGAESQAGVQTRRGGKTVNRRKGGRVTRGTLANVSPTTPSTSTTIDRKTRNQNSESDVYEFHEDSGEEVNSGVAKTATVEDGRPRLILTIKSPAPPVAPPTTVPSNPPLAQPQPSQPPPTSVSEPISMPQSCNPSPPQAPQTGASSSDEFTTPAANTRKSRRLQERDGRSTVDDVIEDVVKNVTNSPKAGSVTPPRRTTRSTMNLSPNPVVAVKAIIPDKVPVDVRKSPRANRSIRNKDRKLSETSTDSNDERKVDSEPMSEEKVASLEVKKVEPPPQPENLSAEKVEPVPHEQPRKPEVMPHPIPGLIPNDASTTLIDPVTGEMMMMRQSKEGQYIPVPRNANQVAHLMAKQHLIKGMPQPPQSPSLGQMKQQPEVTSVVKPPTSHPESPQQMHQPQIPQLPQQLPLSSPQHSMPQSTNVATVSVVSQGFSTSTIVGKPVGSATVTNVSMPLPMPVSAPISIHTASSAATIITSSSPQVTQQPQPQPMRSHPLKAHVLNSQATMKPIVIQTMSKPHPGVQTPQQTTTPYHMTPTSMAAQQIKTPQSTQSASQSMPIVMQNQQGKMLGPPQSKSSGPSGQHPGMPHNLIINVPPVSSAAPAATLSPRVVQHPPPPPQVMKQQITITQQQSQSAPQQAIHKVPPPQNQQPQSSQQQAPQMVIHGGKMMTQPPPSGYATVLQSGKVIQASPPPTQIQGPPSMSNMTKQQHMQVQQQLHQQHLAKQQQHHVMASQKHHLVVKQQPPQQQQALHLGQSGAPPQQQHMMANLAPSVAHQATKHIQTASAQILPPGLPPQNKGVMGLHQSPQILTGAVASPPPKQPHLTSQQPIVTGASSSRVTVPPISPQGQARGHILQAGLPVPAFEASLHNEISGYGITRSQSPPPAHQQASPITPGDGPYPPVPLRGVPRDHHIMMYHHQYIRAQEALNHGARIPYHMPRSPMLPGATDQKSEISELDDTSVASPPLELRRPASGPRTTTAVPHSLQSPQDRATDSPQVAQVYVPGTRIPHPHYPDSGARSYYESAAARPLPSEPPPAHRPSSHSVVAPMSHPPTNYGASSVPTTPTNLSHMYSPHPKPLEREREREREKERETRTSIPSHANMPSHGTLVPAMPAPTGRNLQVATPPHASQVPPQADSLMMLLQRYPVMWQGLLALKNDQAAVQMHFVFGNPQVAGDSLPCNSDGSTPPLRIAQRMRLEQTQLEGVARKMQTDNEHCMLLALPCGRDHMDVLQQSTNLQTGFITYLQQKQAAGIVNIAAPGSQQAAYVVHIFPSCDFANENLARIAPDLLHRVADIAHLLIVIATV